jgi:regulator of protease activity HflC (stomatin/prohibitin superfamily)
MYKHIHVPLNQRTVVSRDNLPLRMLGPGRHFVWGTRLTEQHWDTDRILFHAPPEIRAVLDPASFREVTVTERQRGVLLHDRIPEHFLRPGTHRYWTVDPAVELIVFDVDAPMPRLSDELVALIPESEFVYAVVQEYQRGLEFVAGKLTAVLPPGRYARWTTEDEPVELRVVDMRLQPIAIAGQDLMTRDKVTLRLTLTASYAVTDPVLADSASVSVRDAIYLAVQLAARDYVAGVTLDQLLEGRDELTTFLALRVVPEAERLGARVEQLGVKDVVLPGEMRALLNRVIEAEKEAAANVILRREETNATRSLANTAKVMAENPVLLRLKELDALKEIAERIQEVRLVVGSDGLDKLFSAQLLGPGSAR